MRGRLGPVAGRLLLAVSLLALALSAGCGPGDSLSASDGRLQVITTTGLLKDIVENVGGDRVKVASLVPDNVDPHTFEPTLRDVRDVVYADVAFSNYMLLEQHSIIKTLDANLPDGVPNISLAEESAKYAAEIIPLVENVNLDTIWLGLRARGDGSGFGADRTSEVRLSLTDANGPGEAFGYLTGSFGETEVYFDTEDGINPSDGYEGDTATIPPDAHTHMSWVFTEPGTYDLTFSAEIRPDEDGPVVALGKATFTFAVGTEPSLARPGALVLDRGHADLTVDLDRGRIAILHDEDGGGESTQTMLSPDEVVIEVPSKAIDEVPGEPQFGFMGKPGDQIYQLPQAVLGKHVHGEIDPHLWQNVRNVIAYAKLIRDTLIRQDPAGDAEYRRLTGLYLSRLARLDGLMRKTISTIPPERRQLITTHDAFAYLADAYGLDVAGFVTPNPSTEPSLADRRKLTETVRNLRVPAVFLEPNLAARSSTLNEIAAEQGLDVCPIYGDTFDDRVRSYTSMMRFNADSLRRCLGGFEGVETHRNRPKASRPK